MSFADKENHEVLALQKGCIYGPVRSRRLRRSLGINLLPCDRKVCSFNCIYCQYGLTRPGGHTLSPPPEIFPSISEVEKALVTALTSPEQEIDYITFSGNGEATLHPHFPELVELVKISRDKYRPRAKTAILSNTTTLDRPGIRAALLRLDTPIMKLDVGSPELFDRINRPAEGISFQNVVASLLTFKHPAMIVQALLMGGEMLNATDRAFADWIEIISQVKPYEVHIYSLDRPSAIAGITKIPLERLQELARHATKISGVTVKAF